MNGRTLAPLGFDIRPLSRALFFFLDFCYDFDIIITVKYTRVAHWKGQQGESMKNLKEEIRTAEHRYYWGQLVSYFLGVLVIATLVGYLLWF